MEVDLDVSREKLSRAADGMISNYGEDALAEAKRRALSMRSEGRHTAAATWISIYKLISNRIRY